MQQFLLFCTMLIIASEVFSTELRGSQNPKSTKRRTCRVARKIHYPISDRYMLSSFNFPMFLVPPAYENTVREAPFLVPMASCGCEPKCRKKNFSRGKSRRFRNRKRFRRKHLRKRKRPPTRPVNVPNSFIFNSAESFENFWTAGIQPRRNFTHFFGNEFDSRDSMIRNPNQYIVCLYPVFIRPDKKGTIDIFRKRRFSNSKRQCLINLRNKNKRSAYNLNPLKDISAKQSYEKTEKDEDDKSSRFSHFGLNSVGREAVMERHQAEQVRNENNPYNSNTFKATPSSEKPQNFRHTLNGDLEKYREGILPPELNMPTDLYDGFLDVTQPSVTIPEITFKYPYDPMLYESSHDNARFTEKPPEKEALPEENVKRDAETSSFTGVGKLKEMLEEVESMLAVDSEYKSDSKKKKGSKKKGTSKKRGRQKNKGAKNSAFSLKEKINTVVPILTQISKDLGRLSLNKPDLDGNATCNATDTRKQIKTNIRCSPDGTWKSSIFGIEMTFTTMPNMMLKVKVVSTQNSVINNKWSIQGLTLSKHGGPLMLAAIYPPKKKIASFIGQCKMCQDKDLIFGSWTIYSCIRRFTDLWKAVETKLDILRKEKA